MSKLSGLRFTVRGPAIDGVETGEVGAAAGATGTAAAAGAPGATGAAAAGAAVAGAVVVAVCARAEAAQRETAPMHSARSIIFFWYIMCLVIGSRCLQIGRSWWGRRCCRLRPGGGRPKGDGADAQRAQHHILLVHNVFGHW